MRLVALGLLPVVLAMTTPGRLAAQEPEDAIESAAPQFEESVPTTPASTSEIRALWSATALIQYRWIAPQEADDGVGGWFDQYEFTPNKGSAAPFELGLRDAALDLFGAQDTPLFQARLESPTSNLGVSGSQVDQPFFNQRLDALTRLEGFDVDLEYRRMRTEQLRLFPNTAGAGLLFDDRTQENDRFYRDRTGFLGEARLRPAEAFESASVLASWRPELSLRGGYQGRDGLAQLRIHRDPSNQWFGLPQELERSVADVGGGLLAVPGGFLTVALDFDHQRFRFDSEPITEADLGFAPPAASRTIGFVPSTNRSVGRIRLNGRVGERAVLEAGFQLSQLEQVGRFTPNQVAAGLTDNSVRHYGVNATADVFLADVDRLGALAFNAVFKFDQRDNDIQRDTSLFNPDNGTQIDPFVRGWRRWMLGGELELQMRAANRAAIGLRYEDVGRELEFAPPGGQRILEVNSHLRRDSRIVTVYGRTALRPWRGLSLSAELGYRYAPRTGYIVELEDDVYGQLRASYVFSLSRPLVLSGFVKGNTGHNRDFSLVSGQGPNPAGPALARSYETSNITWGLTVSTSPVDRLNLFASFFCGRDDQETGLDLSGLQRYFQDAASLGFTRDGVNHFDNDQKSAILGGHYWLTDDTDARLSYAFTQAKATYLGGSSASLGQIADSHVIDSDTHGIDFELGHELSPGLRVLAGYRLQLYDDRAPLVASIASVVDPFDRSTVQHTVSLGLTLTSEFFEN